jgi:hypothetical protein
MAKAMQSEKSSDIFHDLMWTMHPELESRLFQPSREEKMMTSVGSVCKTSA